MARPVDCRHDHVASFGIAPDRGGQVHELGRCDGCGTTLHRVSPLHPWEPSDDQLLGTEP